MILGNIFHKTGCQTTSDELNQVINALEFPLDNSWETQTVIEKGDLVKEIFVSLNEVVNKVPESHCICADIHFIAEGSETHVFWNLLGTSKQSEEIPNDDNIFYSELRVEDGTRLCLNKGDYVVYWPGEIHLAGIGQTQVRKLVYKIKV